MPAGLKESEQDAGAVARRVAIQLEKRPMDTALVKEVAEALICGWNAYGVISSHFKRRELSQVLDADKRATNQGRDARAHAEVFVPAPGGWRDKAHHCAGENDEIERAERDQAEQFVIENVAMNAGDRPEPHHRRDGRAGGNA